MDEKNFFRDFSGIHTERLFLRKLRIEDVDDIFEFTSLPETCKILSWYPHSDKNITAKFISSIIEKYERNLASQWGMELKENRKVIGIAGFITFLPEHKKGEIAYVLSPKEQNKGLMTECLLSIIEYGFNIMGLHRIEAKCEIDNFASEKVLQKVGMKLEGCFYDYLIRKGKFRSYKFYSIINQK
ncbi:MAG: GNAT family protein [Candidatus Pacearchaeota archaeon]